MSYFKEDGAMMGGASPTNSVGDFGYTSKGDEKTKGGYDKVMGFRRRKKPTVKEEELDSTTKESKKRFKKNAIPKRDVSDDVQNYMTRFVENKTFSDFVNFCVQNGYYSK